MFGKCLFARRRPPRLWPALRSAAPRLPVQSRPAVAAFGLDPGCCILGAAPDSLPGSSSSARTAQPLRRPRPASASPSWEPPAPTKPLPKTTSGPQSRRQGQCVARLLMLRRSTLPHSVDTSETGQNAGIMPRPAYSRPPSSPHECHVASQIPVLRYLETRPRE